MIESGEVQGYVSATTVTDIFYISKKAKGTLIAKQAIIRILTTLEVCAVNGAILEAAIASNFDDFEDAVQLACAVSEGLDAIVTRNMQGFSDASIDIAVRSELCVISSCKRQKAKGKRQKARGKVVTDFLSAFRFLTNHF